MESFKQHHIINKTSKHIKIITKIHNKYFIILLLLIILFCLIIKPSYCHQQNVALMEIHNTILDDNVYKNKHVVGIIKQKFMQDNTNGQINDSNFTLTNYDSIQLLTSAPTTIKTTNITNELLLLRNYSALSNFKGELNAEFIASINKFWLEFPPTSPKAHYTLGIIYAIMMVFGISGNALVLFMFAKCKSLRIPANTLVINLAVSDFIMMAKAPLFIYNSFNLGPATGELGCHIYGFVGGLTGTLSITTLTAISIDRYNVVVYPLNPLRSTTKWRSRLMVLFVWLYSLFFAGIPLLNLGLSKYVPEGYLTACSFDYLSIDRDERIFMLCYFIFAWVAPFTIITYCYVHILRVVIGANSIQSSKDKNKTEIKLAAIVFFVIGLWFVAWTPYAFVCLLGISGYQNKLTPLGSMLPAIFCKMAACIDPYVYAVTHPRFRIEFGKMFLGKPDTRLQFQTSYNSRGTSRRNKNTCETIPMDMDNGRKIKRGKLERAGSSVCEETDISLSVDLSDNDNTIPNLEHDDNKKIVEQSTFI